MLPGQATATTVVKGGPTTVAKGGLKGYVLFPIKKTQCPQIYIQLTRFEAYDSRKLLLKF